MSVSAIIICKIIFAFVDQMGRLRHVLEMLTPAAYPSHGPRTCMPSCPLSGAIKILLLGA